MRRGPCHANATHTGACEIRNVLQCMLSKVLVKNMLGTRSRQLELRLAATRAPIEKREGPEGIHGVPAFFGGANFFEKLNHLDAITLFLIRNKIRSRASRAAGTIHTDMEKVFFPRQCFLVLERRCDVGVTMAVSSPIRDSSVLKRCITKSFEGRVSYFAFPLSTSDLICTLICC